MSDRTRQLDTHPASLFETPFPGSQSLTTYQGSHHIPFQRWFHFKEAFSPKLVVDEINSAGYTPKHVVDPFGGSGTTAVTCQFLDTMATTIEVNPFLADLIYVKTYNFDPTLIEQYLTTILSQYTIPNTLPPEFLSHAPPAFRIPDRHNRTIFPEPTLRYIYALLQVIDKIEDSTFRTFFRVALGTVLVRNSNVTISGKGRRYRSKPQESGASKLVVDFQNRVQEMLYDIRLHWGKRTHTSAVICHDARRYRLPETKADFAIFSPPYPNSFDYTDIYNIELWTLGYLEDRSDNFELRHQTLHSHVQLIREKTTLLVEQPSLESLYEDFVSIRNKLWNRNIPEMILGYFADLEKVMTNLHHSLCEESNVSIVVGDSAYSGIKVPTANMIAQIAENLGFTIQEIENIRLMRSSAQQGGGFNLYENILRLTK